MSSVSIPKQEAETGNFHRSFFTGIREPCQMCSLRYLVL